MRLHIGACMPPKGGRTAIVAAEVREARDGRGRKVYDFTVGHVERVQPTTVEAARERVAALMEAAQAERPCVILDVSSPQGLALRQALRNSYSAQLHRPHAYPTGPKTGLFASFLQAYSAGRVHFVPGLDHRADLDRALVFYMGGGTKSDGVELTSEEEALVVALGLALAWPQHGPNAEKIVAP